MSFIISIFKNGDLSNIKKKLILLYILNVTDVIFTLFLVNTGMFVEANFLMLQLINEHQLLSLFLKIAIPLILFILVFYRMKEISGKQLYQSNVIITLALLFYCIINLSHIFGCLLYFYV